MVRNRVILIKYLTPVYLQSLLATGHLEFLHELQKCIYLRYGWKLLTPSYVQSQLAIFSKIILFPVLVAILNFFITFIYETLHFENSYFA